MARKVRERCLSGFGARLVISGRVIKHCLCISRELCTMPSLYRPSTDRDIWHTCDVRGLQ